VTGRPVPRIALDALEAKRRARRDLWNLARALTTAPEATEPRRQLRLFHTPPHRWWFAYCRDCWADTVRIQEGFMVHFDVWRQTGLAPDGGQLCVKCVETRLGRRLTPGDFGHDSWVDAWPKSPRLRARMEKP
jgi:hypothetical protein